MADTGGDSLAEKVVENITETVKNETARVPATPEGMAIAYGSLLIMALVPIYWGSFRSLRFIKQQKVSLAHLKSAPAQGYLRKYEPETKSFCDQFTFNTLVCFGTNGRFRLSILNKTEKSFASV